VKAYCITCSKRMKPERPSYAGSGIAPPARFPHVAGMTNGVRIPLGLALKRVAALYRHDDHGRLTSINEWNGGAAPRFFLLRTVDDAICRCRAGLPNDLVSRLEALCSGEPVGDLSGKLPAHYAKYLELLSSHAPVDRVWAGPAYMSTRDLPPRAPPIAMGDHNAHLLCDGFEDWMPDVAHRRPFMAVIENDSVRISDAVHCAGVKTRADHRERGHAENAVAGWARAVRSLGAAPFYSTSWDNVASQGVARRLQLSLVGVDFHLT
jgi:hypothetical protein